MEQNQSNGGAAFPVPQPYNHKGMTLRDYFAAHAPAVPDWFRIEADSPCPKVPTAFDLTTGQRNEFDLLREGKLSEFQATPEAVAFFQRHLEAKAIQDAWRNRLREKKFFAWRWHYADAMLTERAKDQGQ